MARTSLGIVLFLIATSGCAGRPWLARGGTDDFASALTRDLSGPPDPIESTPGFFQRPGDTIPRSQNQVPRPSAQSPPYSLPHNQPLSGGTPARQHYVNRTLFGQQMGAPDLPAFPGSGFTPYYSGSQAAISPGLQEHLVQSTVDQVLVHLKQSKEKSVKANLSDTDELDIERVSVFTDTQGVPGLLESSTATSLPVESGQTPHAQLRRDPLRGLDGKLIQTSITTRGNSFAKPKQWPEVASEMLSSIKTELIRQGLNESERTRLSVMERILYAFLNDTENALAPIKDIDEDESEYWKYFTHGLMISLDADEKNTSSRRAALALRKLRVASDHLANVSRLDVRNLAFCSKVNSYGRFDEFSSYGFKPDQEVLLYVEVENFAVENKGNRYETELQGEYTIFDADGRRIANAGLPLDKQFSMNRRHDYFIAYRVFMPKKIEKGHYFMQLTIEDLKGNKSNQSTLEFWIR